MNLSLAASVELAALAELPARFRLLRLLGAGGFGAVYLASDDVLKREVALKVLTRATSRADVQDAMLAEARALAAVRHPNIAGVLDVLTLVKADVLVLEYVAGGSLGNVLKAEHALSRTQILHLLAGAAAGLEAIHKAGLLHCDLKPENILIDVDGRARIVDFGLARLEHENLTHSSGGSLGYAAPEVMLGEPATTASDWYAFGIVAWELLAGRRAFGASRTFEALRDKLRNDLAPLSTVASDMPAEVRHVIAKCVEVEPWKRPTSSARVAALFRPHLLGPAQESVRDLRGTVILVVLPVLALVTLAGVVVAVWVAPEIPGLFSGLRWHRLLRKSSLKSIELLLAGMIGLVVVIGGVINSAVSILQHNAGSGSSRVRVRDVLRAAWAPPRWWPTWYPSYGTPLTVHPLPGTIQAFRLLTWWGIPVASFASLVVVVLAFSSTPVVSPVVARWVVSGWLLAVCVSLAWLANILHQFKHSAVYDPFELAAVALFCAPVEDIERAFPAPVEKTATVVVPRRPPKFPHPQPTGRVSPAPANGGWFRRAAGSVWRRYRARPMKKQVMIGVSVVVVTAFVSVIAVNMTRQFFASERGVAVVSGVKERWREYSLGKVFD